jgi:hypothetical protein
MDGVCANPNAPDVALADAVVVVPAAAAAVGLVATRSAAVIAAVGSGLDTSGQKVVEVKLAGAWYQFPLAFSL